MNRFKPCALLLLALLLSACGGGGGGGDGGSAPGGGAVPPLSTQCQTGSVAQLALPSGAVAGRNQEVALLACPGAQIASVQWRQVDGPTLALQSARSQALSLTPPSAGRYAFSVEFTDAVPTQAKRFYRAARTGP